MNQILSDYFAFLAFYLCINPGDLYFYMNKIILNYFASHFLKEKSCFLLVKSVSLVSPNNVQLFPFYNFPRDKDLNIFSNKEILCILLIFF
jgi:hypothetical protein